MAVPRVGLAPKSRLRPPPIRRDHRGEIVADLSQLPFLSRGPGGTVVMNVSMARRMGFVVAAAPLGGARDWSI